MPELSPLMRDVGRALRAAMADPAWAAAAGDDDARAWRLMTALCAALHERGPVLFPPPARLDDVLSASERDERIRGEFRAGADYEELRRRHNLSTRQIRRITHPRNRA